MKILAAMSGGVDSAVAAARARDAGHEVTGVHLALSAQPATMREGARGCCSLEDARDARRCADVLDIPFYVWDLAERFRDDVVTGHYARVSADGVLRRAVDPDKDQSYVLAVVPPARLRHAWFPLGDS